LKGEVGAAFSSCIYRIKRFFVKKRLLTPFGFPVADRIIMFAELVGQENLIAGTDCGLGGRVHPQIAWAKLRALRYGVGDQGYLRL
jgi:hypothetical protein